jgi:hypothetical protein
MSGISLLPLCDILDAILCVARVTILLKTQALNTYKYIC